MKRKIRWIGAGGTSIYGVGALSSALLFSGAVAMALVHLPDASPRQIGQARPQMNPLAIAAEDFPLESATPAAAGQPAEVREADQVYAMPDPADQPEPESVQAPAPVFERPAAPTLRPSDPSFDGRRLRKAREMTMLVTAYSPDAQSCGKWADGITASGYSVWTNGMKLVAADTSVLPFGTVISVPGYNGGRPVQVLDRGGAIKGHRLDVLYPTHDIARKWGRKHLTITVWEYAD